MYTHIIMANGGSGGGASIWAGALYFQETKLSRVMIIAYNQSLKTLIFNIFTLKFILNVSHISQTILDGWLACGFFYGGWGFVRLLVCLFWNCKFFQNLSHSHTILICNS